VTSSLAFFTLSAPKTVESCGNLARLYRLVGLDQAGDVPASMPALIEIALA
jgi:hypothetical protein